MSQIMKMKVSNPRFFEASLPRPVKALDWGPVNPAEYMIGFDFGEFHLSPFPFEMILPG